jgi:hypothetical protein
MQAENRCPHMAQIMMTAADQADEARHEPDAKGENAAK